MTVTTVLAWVLLAVVLVLAGVIAYHWIQTGKPPTILLVAFGILSFVAAALFAFRPRPRPGPAPVQPGGGGPTGTGPDVLSPLPMPVTPPDYVTPVLGLGDAARAAGATAAGGTDDEVAAAGAAAFDPGPARAVAAVGDLVAVPAPAPVQPTPTTSAFMQYATSDRRPCCSLVTAWVFAARGRRPKTDPTHDKSWAALDMQSWREINVATGDVWSGPRAVGRLLGGVLLGPGPDPRIFLTIGRWHVVQRWARRPGADIDPKIDSGHAYLVFARPDGKYRVVQSSTLLGYRDAVEETWLPFGYEAMVATLPVDLPADPWAPP
jgi:hypothetical protein